jgi:hypothetical protein
MLTQLPTTATEARERMIARGLNPEICREFLRDSVSMERNLFETVKPMLTEEQRQARRLYVIQAELLLGVIGDACIDQSLP